MQTPTVIVGDPLTLTCNASGNPLPAITWFKNRILVSDNTSNYQILQNGILFHILSAKTSDTTKFSCKVENVAGEREKIFDVNVLGIISFIHWDTFEYSIISILVKFLLYVKLFFHNFVIHTLTVYLFRYV